MTELTNLEKIQDFEIQFRKPFEELEEFLKIANKMLLKSNSCVISYETERRIFKIKVYRCRQSFSSIVIAGIVKQVPSNIGKLLTIANMVDSNHGFLQFSLEESLPIGNNVSGPILKVELYYPHNSSQKKLLTQRLAMI